MAPDADVEIGEDAVAFLRVSVAFRSEHYSAMQKARCGRLKHEFATKLGWLVGNLYSRVPTQDWEESTLSKKVSDFLTLNPDIKWVSDALIRHIEKEHGRLSKADFVEKVNTKPKSNPRWIWD